MPPRKPRITVTPRMDDADWEKEIQERIGGNPFGHGTDTIPLKDGEYWATYIANSDADPNMHYDMTHNKKWKPCTKDDLEDGVTPESIGFRVAADGQTLCRGQRGDEVVYKMPRHLREQILMAQTAQNNRGMGSAKKVKADVANATAGSFGSEAGDFAHSNISITGSDRRGPLEG